MRILALIFLLAAGCGYDKQDYPEQPAPEVNIIVDGEDPPDNGRQPGQATSYAQFQQLADRRCAGCHASDPWMNSETAARDPQYRVFEMIDRQAMPPGGGLQGQELSVGRNFFSNDAFQTAE